MAFEEFELKLMFLDNRLNSARRNFAGSVGGLALIFSVLKFSQDVSYVLIIILSVNLIILLAAVIVLGLNIALITMIRAKYLGIVSFPNSYKDILGLNIANREPYTKIFREPRRGLLRPWKVIYLSSDIEKDLLEQTKFIVKLTPIVSISAIITIVSIISYSLENIYRIL